MERLRPPVKTTPKLDFGVCAPNKCGPPRFCMCYPRGYWGARKGWHAGAHCLTPCLDMGKCDSKGTCSGNQAVTCTSDRDCNTSRCNADPAVHAPKKHRAYADEL